MKLLHDVQSARDMFIWLELRRVRHLDFAVEIYDESSSPREETKRLSDVELGRNTKLYPLGLAQPARVSAGVNGP